MTAALQTQLISVDEYLASEEKSPFKREYTGGYVYAMAGARLIHNQISTSLVIALGSRLRGKPCQPFNSDMKVRVRMANHTRFYYPDAMVVCGPPSDGGVYLDNPKVVCEVLSGSTRRIDESEKRDAYLSISPLDAFLLIETTQPQVLVYRRTDTGVIIERYEGMSAVIPLRAIGIDLPLAEIYERVDFKQAEREAQAEIAGLEE